MTLSRHHTLTSACDLLLVAAIIKAKFEPSSISLIVFSPADLADYSHSTSQFFISFVFTRYIFGSEARQTASNTVAACAFTEWQTP